MILHRPCCLPFHHCLSVLILEQGNHSTLHLAVLQSCGKLLTDHLLSVGSLSHRILLNRSRLRCARHSIEGLVRCDSVLCQIVVTAVSPRSHCGLHITVAGNHDDRGAAVMLAVLDMSENIQPATLRQSVNYQDQVRCFFRHFELRLGDVA